MSAALVGVSAAALALALLYARRRRAPDGRPTILVTGTTGWIGRHLAERLAKAGDVRVLGLARRASGLKGVIDIRADLSTGKGLEALAAHGRIDACVHLGGVVGWCSLEQGLSVNVQGTLRLIEALKGTCSKFVVASSIAAVGTGLPKCPPLMMPMPDEHPYAGFPWAYALSKIQVEELCQMLVAQDAREPDPTLDVMLVRIGCCVTDPPEPPKHLETAIGESIPMSRATLDGPPANACFPEGPIALIAVSDMARCLELAARAPPKLGVRTITATAKHAYLAPGVTVPQLFRHWYGSRVEGLDWSHYERPGHEQDSIYDCSAARRELGFEPQIDLRSYV